MILPSRSQSKERDIKILEDLMAEIVGSTVLEESVSQIISAAVKKYEEKQDSNTNQNLERLEMAHIRLEAALELSEKWQITHSSLLRWHRKLKRAAQECGDTLHKCKHRILEKEQMEQEVRNSSMSNQIVHATKSFAFSIFNSSNDELNESIVQRFEWFADGATEFLRFMELGGTPSHHLTFNSLVKHLIAGKGLHYRIVRAKEYPPFLLWLLPYCSAEHGMEVSLILIHKDNKAPDCNLFFNIVLQLSESTDIVGIAIKCLQLLAPCFKYEVENVKNKLSQLPTQDLSWAAPSSYVYPKEHWIDLHHVASQWYRPNPLCCKQHAHHELRRISNLDISGSSDVSLEPVIHINLQCNVSLSLNNKQKISVANDDTFLRDSPYFNAGILFAPHCYLEDIILANKSSSMVGMVREGQNILHTEITLEQLEDILLPNATEYFCLNSEATVYQTIWKSKHGYALIHVEMATWRKRRISGEARKRKLLKHQGQEIRSFWSWARMLSHLINLWGAHNLPILPSQLQTSFMDCIQKKKKVT